MDTKDAATHLRHNANEPLKLPPEQAQLSVSVDLPADALNADSIEAARRYLTLAALRWQARINERSQDVS